MTAFWFAPGSPRSLALVRIGLACVLLVEVLARAPYVVESYSNGGMPLPVVSLPVLAPPFVVALHGVLIGALLCLAMGLLARVSAIVGFLLLGYFALLDFPGTLTKYTAIALHLLLLLALDGANGAWSVDRRLFGRADRTPCPPIWPRRLIQLLVCHVYLGAALTKMRMRDFATGDTLGFSLIDDRWAGGWLGLEPGAWLATHPRLLVLASFATLAFEFAFPLLVWFERTRRPMLAVAATFHLALACTLSLRIFTPLMLVALVAFVEERDLRALRRLFARIGMLRGERQESAMHGTDGPSRSRTRILAWSVVAWLGVVLATSGLSTLCHVATDAYGVLGLIREPRELQPVPPKAARTMLADTPAASATLVHRIDVGHRASHFHVFGDARRFAPGEVVHVLLRFQQAHSPVTVAATLIDPHGAESQPIERFVSREQSHLLYQFQMTDAFPPGEYAVRIAIDGQLVEERAFELQAAR